MSFEGNSPAKGEIFLDNINDLREKDVEGNPSLALHLLADKNCVGLACDGRSPNVSLEYSNSETDLLFDQAVIAERPVSGNEISSQSILDLFPPCEGPARVLVADDNLLVRVCLMNLLEQWGMTFHICTNGEDAWKTLQESAFDLVLIDLQMPGMDGHEVVSLLRAEKDCENRNIPVIALAGTDKEEAKKRMFEVGANEFLTKPFCPKELHKTLHRHLKPSVNQQASFVDIIDQEQLSSLYEDDYEHMHYMFSLFIKNTSLSLSSIEKAVSLNDLTTLQREVHKVKPTFAMVGLQKIGQLAEKIEAQLEVQGIDHLSTRVQSDISSFRRSIKEGVQLVIKKQQSITNYLK